ncbi:MAG TPA: hypothetical protein DHW15_06245 [Bacteroidetes bacterium]|jgi:hypothetical protein|nr:MAG: hypothetical protein ABR94_10685 [Sphingobacteriales bacterium BACL12 MAG-120802-bin5]KRP13838.1 MAG: hypothetical protein ABR95_02420 [Sphingobacteriales bacterium BACL12 MAG-120813-bin55]HCK21761.1 hypothetical protein [Bacteroidota bacterium]
MLAFACKRPSEQPVKADATVLIDGQLAVVPSMSLEGETVNTSSNIFILRGTQDTIWIFGTGYGDGNLHCDDCNDYTFYRGADFRTVANAIDDARRVDSILINEWNLDRSKVVVQFIAPHFHADHLNAEFVSAVFDSLGYAAPTGKAIYVHRNDSAGAVCNTPCCGTTPCPDKDNPYYAAPYQPAWQSEQLSYFSFFGSTNDTCNQVLMTITSASGQWQICKGTARSDGGHTDGTVNLQNISLKTRIAGTLNRPQCDVPEGWQTLVCTRQYPLAEEVD